MLQTCIHAYMHVFNNFKSALNICLLLFEMIYFEFKNENIAQKININ